MAKPIMPAVAFQVVFDDRHIHPEMVSLNYLSRTLTAVQRLTAGSEILDGDEGDGEESGTIDHALSLLQIRRGSAAFQITSPKPDDATANLRILGKILEDPETLGDHDYVLSPVEELSSISRALHTKILIKGPGKSGGVIATIGPSSYQDISRSIMIKGETSLIGKIERVGGATEKRCGLRIPGRNRMLICRIENENLARELGQKLYEEVTVNGGVTWLKTNWRVMSFMIREVRQPRLQRIEEMFETLRNMGGDAWDAIEDPEEYLHGGTR